MAQIMQFDHVGITVADLDTAIDFFVKLGLELEGRMAMEGEFLDTVCGIPNSRTEIAMLRTPDGHGKLELTQFHTPKNLVMALSVESSELLEIFQWLTPEESQQIMEGPRAKGVSDEVADIMIYLLRLTDVLGVDLDSVIAAKVARNASRFPPVDV